MKIGIGKKSRILYEYREVILCVYMCVRVCVTWMRSVEKRVLSITRQRRRERLKRVFERHK